MRPRYHFVGLACTPKFDIATNDCGYGNPMSCKTPKSLALLLFASLILAGCTPSQPIYLRDTGDLSYFVNQATEIEYPDLETTRLNEVEQSAQPITVINADFQSFYDLTLEQCVAIALQNTKTIRGFGTPALSGVRVNPGVDNLSTGPNGAGTLWNVAIRETEPGFIGTPGQISSPSSITTNTALDGNQGVEAALADFDAQVTSNVFWNRTDEPRNVVPFFSSFEDFVQDQVQWQSEVAKKSANGTQFFVRNITTYTDNNVPLVTDVDNPGFQVLSHTFRTQLEAEVRQPLLRGRGAFIQRMPIVISRIGTDQEIANLEAQMQNMVTNVEIRYWDLHCAYRALEASKTGRNAALETWRIVKDQYDEGADVNIQQVAQAGGQYHFFDEQVVDAFNTLLQAERNLRWLMGLASTDHQILRPIDEPVMAPIEFDWYGSKSEALCYLPALRQTRWEVKKRELAVAYSKNGLLPEFNVTLLYRWLGLGDDLVNFSSPDDFPLEDSGAFNGLAGGNNQEFRIGGEFNLPVGYRRELANVRNAQLKLARERNRLEEQELDVVRNLEDAFAALDANRLKMQKSFNRWGKNRQEMEHFEELVEVGVETLDTALDAQRRAATAEVAFYTSLCEYNKLVALIHRRKGTILAYNGVCFAEGPWSGKAYHDATQLAHKRAGSQELNYGWTRPEVISQGGVYPGGQSLPATAPGTVEQPYLGNAVETQIIGPMTPSQLQFAPGEVIHGEFPVNPQPLPVPLFESSKVIQDSNVRQTSFAQPAASSERAPARTSSRRTARTAPKTATAPQRDKFTRPKTANANVAKPIPKRTTRVVAAPKTRPIVASPNPVPARPRPVVTSGMNWQKMGLTPPSDQSGPTRASIKYE